MFLLAVLTFTDATARLDSAVYDFSLRFKERPPRSDIVIVSIDSKSILHRGEWPWTRVQQAALITAIAKDQPRALAFDFLFLNRSTDQDDLAVRNAMAKTKTFLPVLNSQGVARLPTPSIRSGAFAIGPTGAEGDKDGIVRRTRLVEMIGGKPTPRLEMEMADLAPQPEAARAQRLLSRVGNANLLIPYVGGPGAFRRVSAADVMDGKVPATALAGKFVLLGATAPELLDDYATPVSKGHGMPEVEVLANILDSLLEGRLITPASQATTFGISALLILSMLFALIRLGPNASLWFGIVLAAVPILGSIVAVGAFDYWIPPAPYLVTLALILPYWGWRRLNAASAYFAAELKSLEADGGLTLGSRAETATPVRGDVVLQQMTLLEDAKRRISDLRQLVDDMLANFPDPVLVADRKGAILTCNEAAQTFSRVTGIAVEAGSPILAVLATISAEAAVWPPAEAERPFTGAGPEGRTYELRFTATHDAGEHATGWIVHLADITALVSAMRGREEALQLLSHDMRSPQSAIIALLNHPEFVQAPQTMRGRIEAQARRTLDMADAFVRLAKAEAARYAFEPIDLAFILQDATESVWALAQSGGVALRTESDDAEFLVLADRGLMTRAFVNILDNAVKFSPRGQQIVCRLSRAELEGASAVTCDIIDQAGGMDQDELNDVFTKFASGRDAVSGSPGIGLGLALVRTVVLRHRGVVSCESRRGEGTTFRITLPTIDEAEAERLERELATA